MATCVCVCVFQCVSCYCVCVHIWYVKEYEYVQENTRLVEGDDGEQRFAFLHYAFLQSGATVHV